MVFNIAILLLFAGIVYFHWVQGMLTAVTSMVMAIVASMIAVGYHEVIVNNYLAGAMADYAHGLVISTLFAVVYIVGRLLFDQLVPGNTRVPLYMDKIGGAACGAVAAIFALGTLSIGVQMMPFYSSILFFDRFDSENRPGPNMSLPGKSQMVSTEVAGALKVDGDVIDQGGGGLMLPVDMWVQSFVGFQSSRGALRGNSNFNDVHPNLVMQLYNQRLGVQPGAKRSAMNLQENKKEFSVAQLFELKSLWQLDSEFKEIRTTETYVASSELKLTGSQVALVVRAQFTNDAADKDGVVRLSPGSVRLVAGPLGGERKNYYPVGTLYRGCLLSRNRRDDPIFVSTGAQKADESNPKMLELVYLVERDDVFDAAGIRAGVFIEAKRMGYVDLAGKEVNPGVGAKASKIASGVMPAEAQAGGGPAKSEDPVLRKRAFFIEADKIINDKALVATPSEIQKAAEAKKNAAAPK
jgi:hypothetical protein